MGLGFESSVVKVGVLAIGENASGECVTDGTMGEETLLYGVMGDGTLEDIGICDEYCLLGSGELGMVGVVGYAAAQVDGMAVGDSGVIGETPIGVWIRGVDGLIIDIL